MIEYIELAQTTPWGETCAQVGDATYRKDSLIEAKTYIEQLLRKIGTNPTGTFFKIIDCPHDTGTYRDIKFIFDDDNETHMDYMQQVEDGFEKWDEESIIILTESEYSLIKKTPVIPLMSNAA